MKSLPWMKFDKTKSDAIHYLDRFVSRAPVPWFSFYVV